MDRVFLDANVLFSASYRCKSGLLWLWEPKQIRLITSDYVMEEARRNVVAPDQQKRLDRLVEAVEMVPTSLSASPFGELSSIDLPEKDLPILSAAINARATHLLTGDKKHFGCYFGKKLLGTWIQTPAQYRASKSKDP